MTADARGWGYLTDAEVQTAINALRLAAEVFRAHAITMRSAGYGRLEEQFEKQAREAFDLAAKLEEEH